MCNTSLLLLIITLNNSNYNQEERVLCPDLTFLYIQQKVEVSNNITWLTISFTILFVRIRMLHMVTLICCFIIYTMCRV